MKYFNQYKVYRNALCVVAGCMIEGIGGKKSMQGKDKGGKRIKNEYVKRN